jgi:hypothetical protein
MAFRLDLAADFPLSSIHLRVEDKLNIRLGRDGGLQTFELSGLLTLRVADEKFGRIKIFLENNDQRGIQLQTHPNIDKELFRNKNQIGLKNPAKPFPLNTDVGVLKWRFTTQDESAVPLTSEHLEIFLCLFTDISPFPLQSIAGHRRTVKAVATSTSSTSWKTQSSSSPTSPSRFPCQWACHRQSPNAMATTTTTPASINSIGIWR